MNNHFNLKQFLAEGVLLKEEEYRMGIFDDIDADLIEEEDPIGYLEAIIKYCNEEIQQILNNKGQDLSENSELELTPLQQYVFDYETEISGEEGANNELNNIKKLNSIDDVDQYYGEYRGWRQDRDFQYDLENLINDLKNKF
jgi:hypothetical protein